MMGQNAPSTSLQVTKLGEVVDVADGHAAFQKDFNRLEKWAEKKLMKFKKGEVQSSAAEQK